MKYFVWLTLILSSLLCRPQSVTMRVGLIDFFGTSGIDIAALVAVFPLHPGQTTSETAFDDLKQQIDSAVVRVTGRPATDFSAVCCDLGGGLMIYIGLPGKNSRQLPHLPPPTGSTCLPLSAVDLYSKMLDAEYTAVRQNDAGEDYSKGYALGHNFHLRERQLAMHDYAVRHATLLRTVLTDCRKAKNRQAAAQILGYATPSMIQVRALVRASKDSDSVVRNNAVRALWAIASSGTQVRRSIPAREFVPMLNSDKWEDRNKAGLLVTALTETRDPKLLSELRAETLDSLIEMARWHNAGHADPYRELLGRIAGLDEDSIHDLIANGDVDMLISTAAKGPQ
ncbi:MAG TPA: hypothetical protein VG488_05565 [Candidatus Angelobacter sp.]|jgi:hypothetical protein|nr:hypothetical protein [Candidatus Angelobacter sp.]